MKNDKCEDAEKKPEIKPMLKPASRQIGIDAKRKPVVIIKQLGDLKPWSNWLMHFSVVKEVFPLSQGQKLIKSLL